MLLINFSTVFWLCLLALLKVSYNNGDLLFCLLGTHSSKLCPWNKKHIEFGFEFRLALTSFFYFWWRHCFSVHWLLFHLKIIEDLGFISSDHCFFYFLILCIGVITLEVILAQTLFKLRSSVIKKNYFFLVSSLKWKVIQVIHQLPHSHIIHWILCATQTSVYERCAVFCASFSKNLKTFCWCMAKCV